MGSRVGSFFILIVVGCSGFVCGGVLADVFGVCWRGEDKNVLSTQCGAVSMYSESAHQTSSSG